MVSLKQGASPVLSTVEAFLDEDIRCSSEGDVDGGADACDVPFVAVRDGVEIHLPDREAVRDHLTAVIEAYREEGVATWKRIEADVNKLGDHTVFATVRWNGLDAEGEVLRDVSTTYHLRKTPGGLRFVSYTNHFTRAPDR